MRAVDFVDCPIVEWQAMSIRDEVWPKSKIKVKPHETGFGSVSAANVYLATHGEARGER